MPEKYKALKPKLEKIIQIAALIGVAFTLLSPIIQWAERIYLLKTGSGVLFTEFSYNECGETLELYQEMMRNIQNALLLISKVIVGALLIYVLLSLKEFRNCWKRCLLAALPLIIFACYSAGIYIVTNIRGFTEFDNVPNYYLGDTIYEFMRHPFTYFFCGIFVLNGNARKVLLNIFAVSAMVMNAMSMIDRWVCSYRCFTGMLGSAVFNNTNHYGYYLCVVAVCIALLFVYEDKPVYKMFHGANFALAMAAMISADSLGPYIAIVFTLVMFAVYCRIHEKERFKWVLAALGIVLAINLLLAVLVDSFIISIVRVVFDFGNVLSDPTGSDDAGSGRWQLWKEAVQNIMAHPIFGCGIEGYESGGTAHNEVLQYAVNFGIPLTVLHTAAIAVIIVATFIKKKQLSKTTILCFCCTISYIISAMFGVAIFYTTPFLYLFLGLTYAEVAKSIIFKKRKSNSSTSGEENDTILKKV